MPVSLADALALFQPHALRLPPRALPPVPNMVAALRSVLVRFPPGNPKPPPDLKEIAERVTNEWRSGRLPKLVARDLRFTAQALFAGPTLAQNDRFLLDYLTEVCRRAAADQHGGRSALRLLLAMYLLNFDPANRACQLITKALGVARDHFSPLWRARLDAGRLLDIQDGPRHAGHRLVSAEDAPMERARIGLHGAFAASGFGRAAIAAVGRTLSEQFSQTGEKPADWDRFVTLVAPTGKIEDAHKEAALRAFLEPFLGGAEPAGLREQIKPILLSSFGDPRVNSAHWPSLAGAEGATRRENYLTIVRRWLVSDTIDLFFKIIDRHGLDQHWSNRKKFWRRYFKSGLVGDACVAFASQPSATAQMIQSEGGRASSLKWAALRGNGVRPDHAVLLMQIDTVTVAEWSHIGSVRLWKARSPGRPKFYQDAYSGSALRDGADFVKRHLPPNKWQGPVEEKLRQYIGVGADGRR